jgi:zinc and cadmium transporter
VVFFFLLDKAELWHHGHEHHEHGTHGTCRTRTHDHAHAGTATPRRPAVRRLGRAHRRQRALLRRRHPDRVGLRRRPAAGLVAALAVLAHEVPHHIGDLAVLRQTSGSRRAALVKVSLAGAVTPLGGLVGWWLVDQLHDLLPFFLVVASSSFIYVALADLIPQLQKRLRARDLAQSRGCWPASRW